MMKPKKPSHVDLGSGVVALLGIRAVARNCEKFSRLHLEVSYKGNSIILAYDSREERDASYVKLTAAMRERGMLTGATP